MINFIDGDIISLAKAGEFDVIVHGVNCFCKQKSGLAPQMAKAFFTDRFLAEAKRRKGDINKLGNIEPQVLQLHRTSDGVKAFSPMFNGWDSEPNSYIKDLTVVNAYTQYKYGRNHADGDKNPLNYSALSLCMKKINHIFAGKHIGLPKIGAGLAGGDWDRILNIIENELIDCKVTIVNYKK